jgi:hypothetical protein
MGGKVLKNLTSKGGKVSKKSSGRGPYVSKTDIPALCFVGPSVFHIATIKVIVAGNCPQLLP